MLKRPIDSFTGNTRWLSNFYDAPVEFEGVVYPTTEHAYQAAKSVFPEDRELILACKTPGAAKRMGKEIRLRDNWTEISLGIMKDLNRKKFSDKVLREKLLRTGDVELIEGNNWGDTFWGVCKGVGTNHLGCILMEIRKEIQDGKI